MIKGLTSSPPLPMPVQDSKEWESTTQDPKEFGDVLKTKESLKPEPESKSTSVDKVQSPERVKEEPTTEPTTENDSVPESPPDPKMVDPRMRAQRDRAIRKFMDSFEGEFGIPPQQMVEAMAQLSAPEKEQPPEKTAEIVISQLQLEPQDELKAKKMYLGLLMQLKQIDSRNDLPKTTDTLLSQLSAERLQLGSEKKQFRQQQVQALSDKFWMRGSAENQVVQHGSEPQVMELMKKTVDPSQIKVMNEEAPPDLEQLIQQFESQVKQASAPEQKQVQETIPFVPQVMSPVMKPKILEKSPIESDDQLKEEGVVDIEALSPDVSPELSQVYEKVVAVMKPDGESHKKKTTETPEKVEVGGQLMGSLSPQKFELSPMKMDTPVPITPTEKTENVQQIMNQAQILLKKGGGEVKVEMSPEGLGSIQMKLQVLDGKVQLQMSTETKEAKKMIESSMQDLKTSLAAHQLSMDHVRVDVVNQTTQASDSRQDLQSQMQNFLNQQQKEGTRQFWQQFNENFGNRQARDSYFDAQNIKTGIREQKLPGFAESTPRAGRSDGTRGRSLNLVA